MKKYLVLTVLGLIFMKTGNAATREQIIQWAKEDNIPALIEELLKQDADGMGIYQDKMGNKVNARMLWNGPRDLHGWDGSNIPAEPQYTILDYIALYSSPDTLKKIVGKAPIFPHLYFESNNFIFSSEGVEQEYHGGKASNGDREAIGYCINEHTYIGNPIATLAGTGDLERLKKYIEILKKQSGEPIFSRQINAPVANFCTGKLAKHFIFGGNALIIALLNGYKDIAQYLLDNGALPQGSSKDTHKAFIVRPDKNGRLQKPEELNIRKLIGSLLPEIEKTRKQADIKELEAKKQAEINQLKTLTKEQLQSKLINAIHARDLGKIEKIKNINPNILTEALSDGKSPLIEAPDIDIAQYFYTQYEEQGRKLTKADLKELVIDGSKAWLLKYLIDTGATSYAELGRIDEELKRNNMEVEAQKMSAEKQKLEYAKIK